MIIGALIGVLIGVIGTVITRTTGHLSLISFPVVLLFRSYGLLFVYPLFELLTTVLFWALVGSICGHLIDLIVRRNKVV